ncbi:hypothetical protein AVEN_162636-1 [Araneus ventricosus]|uniref:Uncharacterized protein n=1 Tax=Araneus ventricosus TaxID=182803 RepID=A0A4Y2FDV2_ARAVE|nr:hypothetical protein AVEN_162636-1 [Araneus ventricosus]
MILADFLPQFYQDRVCKYAAWTPDLGDHFGNKFGDEIWDLKGAGIFSISLLGQEIRLNVLDYSMWRHGLPGRLYKECAWITERVNVDRL